MKIFLTLSSSLFLLSFLFISCQQQSMKQDNSAKNKAAMMKIYEAFNTGNTDSLGNYVAEDAIDHQMDTMITKKQGVAGLKEMIAAYRMSFPDLKFNIMAMAASGDTVLTYVTMTGTNSGMMMGMPPTNKSINIAGADLIVFKDGKAVEHWGVEDDWGMMKQLGVMPVPGMEQDKMKKK